MWISFLDRRPEVGQKFIGLWINDNGNSYEVGSRVWTDDADFYCTHWMPIPALPNDWREFNEKITVAERFQRIAEPVKNVAAAMGECPDCYFSPFTGFQPCKQHAPR